MKRTLTKILSLLLAALMLVPFLGATLPSAFAKIARTYTCGPDAVAKLDTNGDMYISGTGAVTDIPWNNGSWEPVIKHVVFGEGITNVPGRAFKPIYIGSPCAVESVELPETIETIDNEAFACSKITEIKLPSSLVSIGKNSFSACENLSRVVFPKYCSLTSIGSFAFSDSIHNRSALRHIAIPLNVKTIANDAFNNCGLRTVFLPRSLESIGGSAFSIRTPLTDIYYEGTEEEWDQIRIDYGYNKAITRDKIHFEASYDQYMKDYYHMNIADTGVVNGIRMVASIDSDEYTFKNHILYDARGNQVDKVTIDVFIANISNDQLDSGMLMVKNLDRNGPTDYYEKTPITIAKGKCLKMVISFNSDELLHLTRGANINFTELLSIFPDADEVDYYEINLEISFSIRYEKSSGAKYCGGFKFGTDTYSFENYTDYVGKEYYYTLFGKKRGDELLNKIKSNDNKIGLCFGMTTTTASFFLDKNKLHSFSANTTSELPETTSSVYYGNTFFRLIII